MKYVSYLFICLLMLITACQNQTPEAQKQSTSTTQQAQQNQKKPTQQPDEQKPDDPQSKTTPKQPSTDQDKPKPTPNKEQPPTEQASVVGLIDNIKKMKQGKTLLQIRKDQEIIGKITIIDQKTNIRYAHRKTLVPVTVDDLRKNQAVSIWCNGPFLKIFPTQCEAKEVVIED
ncbi:hypothetical protein SAMN05444392_102344 [Seinonella peptonophila]|uniref:Uncharacterized protein n=1 Tax=Seinonella peptonophila TaxID=112248 RepID=A0A1M4VFV3_9BACL|nr:hypothetical protein [Seinonella peptonophila]SHE67859.1 hypothetical protein SAMN05444392_102344 [Seinonella peptonophila]